MIFSDDFHSLSIQHDPGTSSFIVPHHVQSLPTPKPLELRVARLELAYFFGFEWLWVLNALGNHGLRLAYWVWTPPASNCSKTCPTGSCDVEAIAPEQRRRSMQSSIGHPAVPTKWCQRIQLHMHPFCFLCWTAPQIISSWTCWREDTQAIASWKARQPKFQCVWTFTPQGLCASTFPISTNSIQKSSLARTALFLMLFVCWASQ